MLVFRVEHVRYRTGPFSFANPDIWDDDDLDLMIDARKNIWWAGPAVGTEIEDFVYGTDHCVCANFRQLDAWFEEAWSELAEVDFGVAVYDIPDHLVRHGRWQSAAPLVSDPIFVPLEDFFI